MVFRRSGVLVGAVLAVCLATSAANAVSIKPHLTRNVAPVVLAEISLATASQAEMRSALQLAIQQTISEELGAMIDDELQKSDVFENVKGVASGALGDMFKSLKATMGSTCQRFASLAQNKLDAVDDRLKSIAEGGSSDTSSNDSNPGSSDGANVETKAVSNVAFLQVAIREKHKGFFDKLKKFAKAGFRKVKSVGRYVKKGLKSIWQSIKPAVADGVRSAVARMKAQIPGLIGQACERAEEKLEHLESKVVPDSVDDDVSESVTTGS